MSSTAEHVSTALDLVTAGATALSLITKNTTARIRDLVERDRRKSSPPSRAVLVVDDHRASRIGMVHELAQRGVVTCEAATVAEARVAIRSVNPAVILCDYHLGGDETCVSFLTDTHRRHRALIVSGRVDTDYMRGIAEGAGAELVERPVTHEALDALIARVVAMVQPA